jgi:hypothetical protein
VAGSCIIPIAKVPVAFKLEEIDVVVDVSDEVELGEDEDPLVMDGVELVVEVLLVIVLPCVPPPRGLISKKPTAAITMIIKTITAATIRPIPALVQLPQGWLVFFTSDRIQRILPYEIKQAVYPLPQQVSQQTVRIAIWY